MAFWQHFFSGKGSIKNVPANASAGKASYLGSFVPNKKNLREWPPVVWLVFFLSLLLILAFVQWWWRFQLPGMPEELVSPHAQETVPVLQLNKLGELHLFGQNIEQNINNLPETTLQLVLKGIYSDPAEAFGSAIIAVPGQQDAVYLMGDTLPGGAVLLDIYEDRVILRRAGQLEVLMLPQRRLETKGTP